MKDTPARVIAVSTSPVKGRRKTNVPEVRLVQGRGIEGDAHAADGSRQLSLLAVESIERIRGVGLDVNPGDFGENITTSGIETWLLRVGNRLEIGDAYVEITQIGKECHAPCAIYQHVGDCVMPREGVFARVLRGGVVRPGDSVRVVGPDPVG